MLLVGGNQRYEARGRPQRDNGQGTTSEALGTMVLNRGGNIGQKKGQTDVLPKTYVLFHSAYCFSWEELYMDCPEMFDSTRQIENWLSCRAGEGRNHKTGRRSSALDLSPTAVDWSTNRRWGSTDRIRCGCFGGVGAGVSPPLRTAGGQRLLLMAVPRTTPPSGARSMNGRPTGSAWPDLRSEAPGPVHGRGLAVARSFGQFGYGT